MVAAAAGRGVYPAEWLAYEGFVFRDQYSILSPAESPVPSTIGSVSPSAAAAVAAEEDGETEASFVSASHVLRVLHLPNILMECLLPQLDAFLLSLAVKPNLPAQQHSLLLLLLLLLLQLMIELVLVLYCVSLADVSLDFLPSFLPSLIPSFLPSFLP